VKEMTELEINLLEEIEKLQRTAEEAKVYESIKKILIAYENEVIKPLVNLVISQQSSIFIKENIFNLLKEISSGVLMKHILPLIKNNNSFIRNKVIEIVEFMEKEPVEKLMRLLDDPDKNVRKHALDILYSTLSAEAISGLRKGLRDENINNVITAVEYIGLRKDKGSVKDIINIFEETTNVMLKCACLEALGNIGDTAIFNFISRHFEDLKSQNKFVVFSYIKLLGKIGEKSNLNDLIFLFEHYGEIALKELLTATITLCQRHKLIEVPEQIIIILEKLTDKNINQMYKYEIINFLSKYSPVKAKEIALKYLMTNDEMLIMSALEILSVNGEMNDIKLLEELKMRNNLSENIKEEIDFTIEEIKKINEKFRW